MRSRNKRERKGGEGGGDRTICVTSTCFSFRLTLLSCIFFHSHSLRLVNSMRRHDSVASFFLYSPQSFREPKQTHSQLTQQSFLSFLLQDFNKIRLQYLSISYIIQQPKKKKLIQMLIRRSEIFLFLF